MDYWLINNSNDREKAMSSEASYDYSGGNGSITNRSEGEMASNEMRKFDTGATRGSEDGKPDYEGFLSPLTIIRYGQYMSAHRKQADGKMRASDNWQKGIPLKAYMKSLWRHVVELWALHRSRTPGDMGAGEYESVTEALCAVIFNASGYLHEIEKGRYERERGI